MSEWSSLEIYEDAERSGFHIDKTLIKFEGVQNSGETEGTRDRGDGGNFERQRGQRQRGRR